MGNSYRLHPHRSRSCLAVQQCAHQTLFRTIPYSEFKHRLAQKEVVKCMISEHEIMGEIHARPEPSSQLKMTKQATQAITPGAFKFRTVRVDDPELVHDLEAAGVKFTDLKPSLLSQFLWIWILPVGVMFLLLRIFSRSPGGLKN